MLFLLACSDTALIDVNGDKSVPVDSAETDAPPVDTASTETGGGPGNLLPWAQITSPEAGATVEGCGGLTLTGEVGGGDGALVVTWYGNGVALWTGAPESNGTTSISWEPADGTWTWALAVSDADGDLGSDERDVTYAPFSAASWDPMESWERSRMDDRVIAAGVGACTGETIGLPTYADNVWDSGTYTPASSAVDGSAAGRTWASWNQVGTVDCHLFRLTVTLPSCGYSAVRLSSPWFAGVPINDNLYVIVGGSTIWYGGTSYAGAPGTGPAEVDYWMAGSIADLDAALFVQGENDILIVTEEYASWGGMGFLEVQLVE